jgi:magnesium transporter
MAIRAYQIDPSLRFVAFDLASWERERGAPEVTVWIDLLAPTDEELVRCLELLDVRGLARRLMIEARDRPGVYPLKHEVVVSVPFQPRGEHADSRTGHLTLLCRGGVLLSVHDLVLLEDPERERDDADAWLPGRTTSALVATMMMMLSQYTLQRMCALRRQVLTLEDRMERDPESVTAEELVALRPDLATHAAVVADQHPAMQVLATLEKPYFKLGDALDYMHCTVANLGACERAATGLEQRLAGLRAAFQMHAQERANRRLYLLTVLSAMFMPLTLLAGLWGMNFDSMPELHLAHGYPLALSFMALVAVVTYWLLRRRGWFG